MTSRFWSTSLTRRARTPRSPERMNRNLGQNEDFITLLSLIEENKELREYLFYLTLQDDFHRSSLVNTLADEMKMKGAPVKLVEAILSLLDPNVAKAIRLELKKANPDERVNASSPAGSSENHLND